MPTTQDSNMTLLHGKQECAASFDADKISQLKRERAGTHIDFESEECVV